jgi:hypothetical protein
MNPRNYGEERLDLNILKVGDSLSSSLTKPFFGGVKNETKIKKLLSVGVFFGAS